MTNKTGTVPNSSVTLWSPPTLQVLDLIRSTVADERVKVELVEGFDPLPVSASDEAAFGFQIIKKTVLDMFPQLTVAPGESLCDTEVARYRK